VSARVLSLLSVALLGAALLALVLWLPGYLQPAPSGQVMFTTEAGCSVSQSACRAVAAERAMTLSMTPTPVRSVTPLQVSVHLDGVDAQTVQLSLEGQDMYMGINQIQLSKDSQSDLWRGVAELAVCTTGEMSWRARVTARQGQQTFEAAFDFNAR
jgi:hypothetical protein